MHVEPPVGTLPQAGRGVSEGTCREGSPGTNEVLEEVLQIVALLNSKSKEQGDGKKDNHID